MQPIPTIFSQLDPYQLELIQLSYILLEKEESHPNGISDFSFIVFPTAKAYEGFLKEYLLKAGFIDKETYMSRRFRIGRALNPDLHTQQQDERWLYDDLSHAVGSDLAREVWDTWLTCRNHVFHYFPEHNKRVSLQQARECLTILTNTIEAMLKAGK